MENNSFNHFSYNYKEIIIDEIALEGLEGIDIALLWRRLERRISSSITEKMKCRYWNFIVKSKSLSFYQVLEPFPHVELLDRFTIVDEDSGQLKAPEDYVDGPYEYNPVENDYGSCVHYKTRTMVPKDQLETSTYEKVVAEYGSTLVIVACIEERWRALAPHMSITYLTQLSPVQYCMLELIGKARENGQMTVGKTNLTKIVKDSKLIFYNRKSLQELDLIRVLCITQVMGTKGMKSLLLRLRRFHKPSVMSMPKIGKLHNILQYLKAQPDHCEQTEVIIKKGLLTQFQNRRLQKTVNIFRFEERVVQSEESTSKKTRKLKKKRFISLCSKSDESSHSDEETNEVPLKCQYKVKVNLQRQAYERLLDAGLNGLTQIEISQLLGVEFYTSRRICKLFKSRNIVREFLEDKGRQRTARYIAVAATGEMDVKYKEQKKKYLEYMDHSNILVSDNNKPSTSADSESYEVPRKKIKLEDNVTDEGSKDVMNTDDIENEVIEIKVLDGLKKINCKSLLNSKKNLTLRQLKFANGVLKITREKFVVSGYQTLNQLVAKEIDESPMDTKALKLFVQKLVTDGQIKILRMKWPSSPLRYSTLICAPHINCTHSLIKAKYKELCLRSHIMKKIKMRKEAKKNVFRPLSRYAYPRYMKIQKLHEFLVNLVYFDVRERERCDSRHGLVSMVNILPELTVEFAIGNISNVCISDVSQLKINENDLPLKLCEAPSYLYTTLLQSNSLRNSIVFNLRVLAMLGLIQLIERPSTETSDQGSLLSYSIYVNKNAKIVDTTGVWPKENVDIKSLQKSFYFGTFEDVKNYWKTVYDISTNTTIELSSRGRKKMLHLVRSEKDVQTFDNGECYGDGLGPCGFDSNFYMEIPRQWRTLYFKPRNSKQPKINRPPQIKIAKTGKPALTKKKAVANTAMERPINKIISRKRQYDQSIKWSVWDDNIITMCKAAITIMSPVSQPGCLSVRNTVIKDILSIKDPKKTIKVCHRRALILESNLTLTNEKQCIINELRRRRSLIYYHEGLLKNIRLRYSGDMTKFVNEARLPMLELVWVISQLTKSEAFTRPVPCVALSLEDFHRNFTISPSSANRSYNMYRASNEPVISTLKEAMVLIVMLSHNTPLKPDVAKRTYSILKSYPEMSLRIALEQLRKCGAISSKEKIYKDSVDKFKFSDIVQSCFKISVLYSRKWINKLNSEFVDNLAECIATELPQNCIKGSPEVNCMICELLASDAMELVSVTVPVIAGATGSVAQEEQLNVLDIQVKYKFKSGTLGWQNKCNLRNFSELYRNIQLDGILDSLSGNIVVPQTTDNESNGQDVIISHLKEKSGSGSTLEELQEVCNCDTDTLVKRLSQLEGEGVVKRVGYYENRIVLTEYSKDWVIDVGDRSVLPTPWLTLDAHIRPEIFFKWCGVIMDRVFRHPGSSVTVLSESCEFLSARAAQDACMFLEKCQCVKLKVIRPEEPDLFSEDEIVELRDYNQYESPDNILVFPLKNSLTQYAYVRRAILEKYYDILIPKL